MTGAAAEDRGELVREMGIDHADFWRLLPQAVGEHPWTGHGSRVSIEIGNGRIEVELGDQRERKIALISIPVTPVTIRWQGVEPAAFARFLGRFDAYYRRGGG